MAIPLLIFYRLELVVRAEHIHNLVDVHLLHALAGGLEVLARVEVVGMLSHVFTDGGSHGQTAVAVDIDLADGALGGLAQLLLGDTHGGLQGATVGVDGVDLVLWHGAGAVEHDGEAGKLLLNGLEDVEGQGRRQQTAGLGVDGALLGFELVGAVAGADTDGQRVTTGTGGEVDDLLGLGVVGNLGGYLVLDAGQHTELALDGDIILVGIFHHLTGNLDILLVGQGAAVVHHAGEAHVDAAFAGLEAVAVVEMENNLGVGATQLLGILNGTLGHVAQEGGVGIVAGTLADLQNDGTLGLDGGLDDGLHLLHVVEVEGGDGIAAIDGFLEHLAGIHETDFLVIYHIVKFKV